MMYAWPFHVFCIPESLPRRNIVLNCSMTAMTTATMITTEMKTKTEMAYMCVAFNVPFLFSKKRLGDKGNRSGSGRRGEA